MATFKKKEKKKKADHRLCYSTTIFGTQKIVFLLTIETQMSEPYPTLVFCGNEAYII